MENVLTQEEIDNLVSAARSRGLPSAPAAADTKIEAWDVRRAGQIGREQLQAITSVHEGFARNLTHALGAYLRVALNTALVSAEHLTYREFLHHVPETTYLASCRLEPMGASGALQMDLKIAFPIIDLLLGGEGASLPATREITEIEEQILESVMRIVCRELGAAWHALAMEVEFEQRMELGMAQRLLPPEEKLLSLSFEVTLPEVRGGLNLAVPASVSTALLRKISGDWSRHKPRGQAGARQTLMRRLLDCPFAVELAATPVRASVADLSSLVPGQLLRFARSATQPVTLLIAGAEMFQALPARRGQARAAQLLGRSSQDSDAASGKAASAKESLSEDKSK
jgi:flagellar motor switch protein FliM